MPFRILSLDGGGIRGLVSAYMLLEIEKKLKEKNLPPIREYFDMIAGTSTGSILAAGIALGYPIDKLVNLYREQGLKIFPYQNLLNIGRLKMFFKYGISAPKFSNEGLIDVLKSEPEFHTPMKELGTLKEEGKAGKKPIVLILAFDTMYRNTTFFTNYHMPSEGNRWYNNIPVWEICVSSASAPTFFPAYELKHREENKDKSIEEDWSFPHVDGGVTANNPSLCAIARAIQLGHKLEDISLLSVGTGQNKKPLNFNKIVGWGLIQWGLRVSDVFMEGQAELQSRVCLELMGGATSRRYLRLQFDLNTAFGKPKNYLAQAPILSKAERHNVWTEEQIKEAMDDARPDNIDKLTKATQKYLSEGKIFENRYEHFGNVGDEIEKFIVENFSEGNVSKNPEPRECYRYK